MDSPWPFGRFIGKNLNCKTCIATCGRSVRRFPELFQTPEYSAAHSVGLHTVSKVSVLWLKYGCGRHQKFLHLAALAKLLDLRKRWLHSSVFQFGSVADCAQSPLRLSCVTSSSKEPAFFCFLPVGIPEWEQNTKRVTLVTWLSWAKPNTEVSGYHEFWIIQKISEKRHCISLCSFSVQCFSRFPSFRIPLRSTCLEQPWLLQQEKNAQLLE